MVHVFNLDFRKRNRFAGAFDDPLEDVAGPLGVGFGQGNDLGWQADLGIPVGGCPGDVDDHLGALLDIDIFRTFIVGGRDQTENEISHAFQTIAGQFIGLALVGQTFPGNRLEFVEQAGPFFFMNHEKPFGYSHIHRVPGFKRMGENQLEVNLFTFAQGAIRGVKHLKMGQGRGCNGESQQ